VARNVQFLRAFSLCMLRTTVLLWSAADRTVTRAWALCPRLPRLCCEATDLSFSCLSRCVGAERDGVRALSHACFTVFCSLVFHTSMLSFSLSTKAAMNPGSPEWWEVIGALVQNLLTSAQRRFLFICWKVPSDMNAKRKSYSLQRMVCYVISHAPPRQSERCRDLCRCK